MTDHPTSIEEALAEAGRGPPSERYQLRLFITGLTRRSTRALENVRASCAEHLRGRYELEVIDIYQQPAMAREEQILAAPTLIKRAPLPHRRMIGDMSSAERVLAGLDIKRAVPA